MSRSAPLRNFLPLLVILPLMLQLPGFSQQRPSQNTTEKEKPIALIPAPVVPPPRTSGPKPYSEVITSKAISDDGLFKIHKVDDKYYFEITDSILGKDILVVNRLSKAAAGMRNIFVGYAGDLIGENVFRFEKGPNNKVFIRGISYDEMSRDSSLPMYRAVSNSNIQPIIYAFDMASLGMDSTGVVVDVTGFLNSDNDVLNFDPNQKRLFRVGSLQSDKSYISTIKAFPKNLEIKTVKTYTRSSTVPQGTPTTPLSAANNGTFTVEINSSILLLPSQPMKPRYYDERIGYFARQYVDFDMNPQGIENVRMITRWRLEPKPEDVARYKRGELVEPRKPIVFYIDPATPTKWVPYLMQGVNDWQKAFEQAGFKNAIIAKEAPTNDPDWSIEDARYSAIVYKPSDIPNASGPHVHDPRSGEILESHINWYHNVMELLHDWYFIQAAPLDARARKPHFDDSLMGQLIRFVSSHEVGHALGLRHNFGSSSTVQVEKLRDKKWLDEHGHTPSIMDYSRFNYVAQPEDNIDEKGIFPRIGDYDKWAIEWGYKWIPEAANADQEKPILNRLTIERLKNKRLWFGTETNPDDPRSQSEDLGDNAMVASSYGIKNLQRIVQNLPEWTKEPNQSYETLERMYNEVIAQYLRYIGHVTKNIGGITETPKTAEQGGTVYEIISRDTQKEAMAFLNRQVFLTPTWLLDHQIFSKTGITPISVISRAQDAALSRLLNGSTLNKLVNAEAELGSKTYTVNELLSDLRRYVFAEVITRRPIDIYRRNLQKNLVERMIALIKPGSQPSVLIAGTTSGFTPGVNTNTDAISFIRGTLRAIQTDVKTAIPLYEDIASKYHLQDLRDRIEISLNSKE